MQKPQIPLEEYKLVPISMGCLDAVCELLWEAEIREFLCDNVKLPKDVIQTFIEQSIQTDDRGQGLWGIQDGAELLGIVGLRVLDIEVAGVISEKHPLETMVAITRAAWGRGIAWRALEEVHEFARLSLGLSCVFAVIDEPNLRSRKLFEKLEYVELTDVTASDGAIIVYKKMLRD